MNKLPDVVNFRNLSWLPPLLDTFGLNRHLCSMQKEFVRKFLYEIAEKASQSFFPKFFCRNFHGHVCEIGSCIKTRLNKPEIGSA